MINLAHINRKGIDKKMRKFIFNHPVLSYLTMLIAMPIFILLCVVVLTLVLVVPLSLIFGWF